MAIGSNEIGLLFRARGDTSDAKKAFSELAQSLGLSESSAKGLATALPYVGTAIASVAAAATGAAIAIFELTKNAAEFGSAIFDASEKTGLGAQTLSAMKFAADQSGTSLEAVTAASAKFARTIGDAANGSEKAQAKLDRLGVTSKDLDTALTQALATIVKLPPGTEQMTAAMDAFGKSGTELLPFIKSFDGDLEGLKKRAEELGVSITDEAAKASDDFGDTLDTLSAQAAGLGRQFAYELMPQVTEAMKSISQWMSENKGKAAEWGAGVSTSLREVIDGIDVLGKSLYYATGAWTLMFGGKSVAQISGWALASELAINSVTGGIYSAITALGRFKQAYDNQFGQGTSYGEGKGQWLGVGKAMIGGKADIDADKFKTSGGGGGRGGGIPKGPKEKTPEQIQKEEEQALKKSFDARIAEIRRYEAEYMAAIERIQAKAEMQFEQGKLDEQAYADVKLAISAKVAERKSYYLALEFEAAEKYGQDTAAIESKMGIQRQKNAAEAYQNAAEMYKKIGEARKEYEDALKKYEEDDKKRHKDWVERANEQIAFLEKMRAAAEALWQSEEKKREEERQKTADKKKADYEASPMGMAIKSFHELKAAMESVVGMQNVLGNFFSMAVDGFMNMAGALGNSIAAWALYGDSIGKALRKALASEFAHIAAVATVNTIYATALGFLRLAQWDLAGATNAFISAGIWASIAGGSALAAKAVAGDAFKRQTAGNFGTAQTGTGQQRSGNSGGAYSSQEDQVVEVGRNDPGGRGILGELRNHIVLEIRSKTDHIVDVVTQNIQGNGRLRTVIQDAT